MMGLPREKVRVITEDVGGAFGLKTPAYPEYPALLVAAKLTGRPVAWMATRSEVVPERPAGARHGHARPSSRSTRRASSSRCASKHIAEHGRLHRHPGANIQTMNFSRCFPGMYAIPRIQVGVQCVFTNTVPTGPYRGAGRPEANYALERLVDEAARVTGIDPVRLRRRNLIPPQGDPLQDRGRHDLRLRRLRADPRQGAGARALRRTSRSAAASRPSARSCAASASRAFSSMRARCRPKAPRCCSRRRQAGARHRRAEHRTGPRHDLSAPDRREARHPGRADRAPARRHQSRPEGQSVGRLALHHDGRQRALSCAST